MRSSCLNRHRHRTGQRSNLTGMKERATMLIRDYLLNQLIRGCAMKFLLAVSAVLMTLPATLVAKANEESPATMLVVGRIWTADSRRPLAEAVAVRDDKIVAVGSRDELNAFTARRRKSSMRAPVSLCRG